ncbi:fungal-specific transcription factor domain-containing protein [Circinella umbellata]|nr:fungal-specific transcription factor domain-containing protein [Circinella umbellata]
MNNNNKTIPTTQPTQITTGQSSNSDKEFDHKLRILSETTIKNGKRSCDSCRLRKVRCDANTVFPCTKCQKSKFVCEFRIKKRKPGPVPRESKEFSGKRIKHTEKSLTDKEEARENFIATTAPNRYSNITSISTASALSPVQRQQLKRQKNQQEQSQMMQILPLQQTITFVHDCNNELYSSANLINKIPHLTLGLAEHMLEGYFKSVHFKWPIINKYSFLTQFYYQYPEPLDEQLFYAVCAMGYQFLPWRSTYKNNTSVRSIGRYLRHKVTDFTDLILEQPPSITAIQALILAISIRPNSNDGDELIINGQLIDIGPLPFRRIFKLIIHMSKELLLFSSSSYQNLPKSEVELRRRIVYAIYTVDRIGAASKVRQFNIMDGDLNVELPSIYEVEPKSNEKLDGYHLDEGCVPKLLRETDRDIQERRPVYSEFLQIISLTQMVGDVLILLYFPTALQFPNTALINKLDNTIIKWQSGLVSNIYNKVMKNITKDMVIIMYNAVLLLRYRPLIFTKLASKRSDPGTGKLLKLCTDAALNIIEQFESDSVLGIPCFTDYMVGEAASIFIQNSNDQDPAVRSQAQNNLIRCTSILMRDEAISGSQNAKVLKQLTEQMPTQQIDHEIKNF